MISAGIYRRLNDEKCKPVPGTQSLFPWSFTRAFRRNLTVKSVWGTKTRHKRKDSGVALSAAPSANTPRQMHRSRCRSLGDPRSQRAPLCDKVAGGCDAPCFPRRLQPTASRASPRNDRELHRDLPPSFFDSRIPSGFAGSSKAAGSFEARWTTPPRHSNNGQVDQRANSATFGGGFRCKFRREIRSRVGRSSDRIGEITENRFVPFVDFAQLNSGVSFSKNVFMWNKHGRGRSAELNATIETAGRLIGSNRDIKRVWTMQFPGAPESRPPRLDEAALFCYVFHSRNATRVPAVSRTVYFSLPVPRFLRLLRAGAEKKLLEAGLAASPGISSCAFTKKSSRRKRGRGKPRKTSSAREIFWEPDFGTGGVALWRGLWFGCE